VTTGSAILADLDTGQVLFTARPDERRPIASVTKIMTALLVLERTTPSDVVTVSREAASPAGSNGLSELGLEPGERITVGELEYALLLQSANDAAVALAEQVSGTEGRFISLMNARAKRLGMTDSHFRSPNGLDDRGYSSARDLVTLTRAAYAADPRFQRIVATKYHDVPSSRGSPTRHIQNRDVLLWLYPGAIGVKTGYTTKAGFCVVAAAERDGRRLIAVVLGASGEPFSEAAELLNYGFSAFTEQPFVHQGESIGVVPVRGGAVDGVTGDGLSALVPVSVVAKARRTVIPDPRAAYPPAPGERIATLRVTIPGHVLGEVPVLAAQPPPPPPVDDRPWWRDAASTVSDAFSGALRAIVG
jgi:D-alanyl-D-alanine carboxypeptidase (penicillin-binding protein 5/6)